MSKVLKKLSDEFMLENQLCRYSKINKILPRIYISNYV